MSEKEYKTRTGDPVKINASAEACAKFGFKPGQRCLTLTDEVVIVVGVGPNPLDTPCAGAGEAMLWIQVEGGGEAVFFFPDPAEDLVPIP